MGHPSGARSPEIAGRRGVQQRSHRGCGSSRSRVQQTPHTRRSIAAVGIDARHPRHTGAKSRSAKPAMIPRAAFPQLPSVATSMGVINTRRIRSGAAHAAGVIWPPEPESPHRPQRGAVDCYAMLASSAARITSTGAGLSHHRSNAATPCQRSISRPSAAGTPAEDRPRTHAVPPRR